MNDLEDSLCDDALATPNGSRMVLGTPNSVKPHPRLPTQIPEAPIAKRAFVVVFTLFTLASGLCASIQVPDGVYDSDSAGTANDGKVFSANGGGKLGYIGDNGGSATYEWVDPDGPYKKAAPPGAPTVTAEFEQVLDGEQVPVPGKYSWRAFGPAGGLIASGVLCKE